MIIGKIDKSQTNFIKSIGIIIIVTSHYCMFGGVEGLGPLGRYLGNVGNNIFLAVSALVFGQIYGKKGVQTFEAKTFLKKKSCSNIIANMDFCADYCHHLLL